MANTKFTRAPRKSPLKQSAKALEFETIAPAVDPYLRPETVTVETLSFGDVALPPVLRGLQPGTTIGGASVDHSVTVIHVNRRQIDEVLRAIGRQNPDLETVLKIVNSFMCRLDSLRDEAIFGLSCLTGQIKAGEVDKALASLVSMRDGLGHWNDPHRLHLH